MQQYNLTQGLINPDPNGHDAVLLHRLFRERIKQSFILLVQEVAKTLKKDYEAPLAFLKNINSDKRYSLRIFYSYYSLLAYIANNDIRACEKLCDSLCSSLTCKNIYNNHFSIETVHAEEWEKNFSRDVLQKAELKFEKLDDKDLAYCKNYILEAIEVIKQSSSDMSVELSDHVSLIYVPKGDISSYVGAGSGVKYFGVLFITAPCSEYDPLLYFFDLIAHELSHTHLNIIMGLDSIVLNDSSERYLSPARNTLRPMKGIFHAHFVFYRLIYMYLKAEKVFNPNNESLPKNISVEELDASIGVLPWEYKRRLVAWIHKFKQGEEIIRKHAKLTKIGEQLFDKMSENFLKMTN
jgi:hypothetical protein